MTEMFAIALLLGALRPDVANLDMLARGRDVDGLLKLASPELRASSPFAFLQRPGAFGTGSKGWHAYELRDPVGGRAYIVFGTPLTTQDYGEVVFDYASERLVRLEDERETRGYKILHYEMSVGFVPREKTAEIEATVRLRRSAKAELCVHLRLSPNYRVAKVADASGAPLKFAQASGVVSVAPPAGAESQIKLTYSGVVDRPHFAGAITNDEAMLTNDYWWPMVARGPATVSTTARVPSDWIVVTHGKKVSDIAQGAVRTVRYQMDVPISYLSLSAGKFQHAQKKVGRVTYHVWSRKMSEADMNEQLDLMPPVIEFYERFAPYPFEDFGAMVSDLYGGGALEAYSFATYGTGWLPDEDTHEPAHSWWGGLLANTYLNSYWNESFAVYSGGLYAREAPSGNVAEKRRAFVSQHSTSRDYEKVPIANGGVFESGVASSLGYGKGASVLQQLEREIGTENMVASMRRWILNNPQGEAAEWSGFEKAVSATVGQDMAWFFDQWIRKSGAPEFEVRELGYSGGAVRGLVDFKGAPYRLKTEVYAEMVDGTVAHVDVNLNPQKKEAVSEFSFVLPKKPKFVSFDPYDRILRDRPASRAHRLAERLPKMRTLIDPKRSQYAKTFDGLYDGARVLDKAPEELDGVFLIGHPDTVPAMRDLCRRAGFAVRGDALTYDGTTIDLKSGAAVALIDLDGGATCAIGLGVTKRSPDVGISRLCLTDSHGRFLRGKTEPRREGPTVFRVP